MRAVVLYGVVAVAMLATGYGTRRRPPCSLRVAAYQPVTHGDVERCPGAARRAVFGWPRAIVGRQVYTVRAADQSRLDDHGRSHTHRLNELRRDGFGLLSGGLALPGYACRYARAGRR